MYLFEFCAQCIGGRTTPLHEHVACAEGPKYWSSLIGDRLPPANSNFTNV
jgi:hypothetical protein